MRAISKVIGAAMLIVLGTAFQAQALSITPGLEFVSGNQNSQSDINAFLLATYGISGFIYKDNVGGSEEGALAANYQTTFLNSAADPSGANIVYVGGTFITGNPIYLLVKDGNHQPAWYLFNLTTITGGPWNGTETLALSGFWPEQGAISNVQIFGTPGTQVPDGGSTPMLLSMALMGLAVVRRKFNR